MDSVWLQAILFTGLNVLFIALSAWWLYLSRTHARVGSVTSPSARVGNSLALALGLSALQLVAGAFWDASMHIQTGQIPSGADFLWPPHIVIYSSFLFSFLVALLAMGTVARSGWRTGARDPRLWVRRNPYLGAIALASIYSIFAIPGDALWHQLFGIDLTAWSPPHLMIGATMCAVVVCAVGLFIQTHRTVGWTSVHDFTVMLLLGLMLNIAYLIGVIEWETLRGVSPQVAARPAWSYPLVGGGLSFFTLLLAKHVSRTRWAATGTALMFYGVRLAVTVALSATGNIAPALPLVFLGGALLLDLVPFERIASGSARTVAIAAAFTAGYTLVALPLLRLREQAPPLSQADLVITLVSLFITALLLEPLASTVSSRLVGAHPFWGDENSASTTINHYLRRLL